MSDTNLKHDWFLQEKIEQAPGGFLSPSVFLPFNKLGYICLAANEALYVRLLGDKAPAWQTQMH